MMENKWIFQSKGKAEDGYKLFCIPYAGAGASVYRTWQSLFGNEIKVVPIQLPGRENRFGEKLVDDAKELASQIFEGIKEKLAGRFSIFGHSMGGIIAYELTVLIEEKLGISPDILFMSATALQPELAEKHVSRLSDEQLIKYLTRAGGTVGELIGNENFRQVYFPIIRNDYCLVEQYKSEQKKIKAKIRAFASYEDREISYLETQTLNTVTDNFSISYLDGGHFFIQTSPDILASRITEEINFIWKEPDNKENRDIAIIGMDGIFPMAQNIGEFWDNMLQGKDCITRRPSAETDETVKYAYGAIAEPFCFDNEFFHINPVEANDISPQERLLLEVSYKALEDAGCVPNEFKGKIGIVCGAPENDYRNRIMLATQAEDELSCIQFSDSSLVTRVSYKLNLTGPCLYLLTACATSLTAVHMACNLLRNGEADVMLAGGSNVYPNQDIYGVVDGLLSRDGVVRAFDKDGSGTVPGNGVAMVVLKRLEDAKEDKDHIYAVIKGSAIGNDGNRKVGFTAPSLLGQIEVLEGALSDSGVQKDQMDFIETHGTATPLGDAVELSALKAVYEDAELEKPILLGALKSNYGHLNMVAGIAGLIKGALVLQHGIVPPGINIAERNEELKNSSILEIADHPVILKKEGRLLHGAISSFGMGGVNANVILEEYRGTNKPENKLPVLLCVTGKSLSALERNTESLEEFLENQQNSLGKASYTALCARAHYKHRRYLVASEQGEILYKSTPYYIKKSMIKKRIVFMFPGMGSDYESMGLDMFGKSTIFQKFYTQCRDIVLTITDGEVDLFVSQYPSHHALNIVSVSYCIAKTLEMLGIKPDLLIGHSLGEYAMAMYNGIFSLEEGLKLVYIRNEMIQTVENGMMIGVNCSREKLQAILPPACTIAVHNTKDRYTLSFLEVHGNEIMEALDQAEISYKVLNVQKPYHTKHLRKIETEYLRILNGVQFCTGNYNMVSTYYGRKIEKNEISHSDYWIAQMSGMVEFYQGYQEVLKEEALYDKTFCIEVGGNHVLTNLVKQMTMDMEKTVVIPALGGQRYDKEEYLSFLEMAGELWKCGIKFEYSDMFLDEDKEKISLPSYSFEKHYFNKLGQYYPLKSAISIESENWDSFKKMDEKMDLQEGVKLIGEYDGLQQTFDDLCVYEAAAYFTRKQVKVNVAYSIEDLIQMFEIIEGYIPFFRFLLRVLEKRKAVELEETKVTFHQEIYDICKENILQEAKGKFPQFEAYMELLSDCASCYKEVFTGQKQGNEILYPEGSFDMLEQVYQRTPNTTMKDLYRDETVEIVKQIAESTNGTLRILEIGSGTGRMTWPLMEQLKEQDVEYWFTDIGGSFVNEGKRKAEEKKFRNMNFTVLNIESGESEVPLGEGYFDIVLGLDVIQATSNIVEVLENLKDFLKPLGWIFMVQSFWLHDIEQMIFGYSPGWWNYVNDPLRKDTSFVLDEEGWKNAFVKAGLYNVRTLSGGSSGLRRESGIIFGMKEGKRSPAYSHRTKRIRTDQEQKKDYSNREGAQGKTEVSKDPILEQFMAIIYETIGKEGLTANDSLSDIGVDSLAILIVRSKIKKQFQCELLVKDFYECKTIGELAEKIKSHSMQEEVTEQKPDKEKKNLGDLFDLILGEKD
ncbi:type I polyketide synthase [[Clostridium] polysaccharolyticum]|uniref:Acyl transferase domain-containing protein n=1 Tax=[Clostridium] polysaccharolyticum TaxID=29364 RepID=A0A1I0AEF6_9FIRM|nr:type I polyketide synthase [[Clostridium] polysaccharolyticum]SES92628.1 Acyl transferase domain-containing protein [[Clostridium] polysaccharolyticum]